MLSKGDGSKSPTVGCTPDISVSIRKLFIIFLSCADLLIYGDDLISGSSDLIRPGHLAHVLAELPTADNEEIILPAEMQFLSSPLQLLLCRQAFLGGSALHHESTQYNFRFWLRLLFAN